MTLQAIKRIRIGKDPPGMDQVTLELDRQGGVNMTVLQLYKPNVLHKPVGMIKVGLGVMIAFA